MKKYLISLLACVSLSAFAQTSTNLPPASTGIWDTVGQTLEGITNFAVAPYFTYAKDAPKHFGGGLLGVYNVNNNLGLGTGVDWLGEFSMVNANVSLKLPIHPFGFIGHPEWSLSPFGLVGFGTPLSGAEKANGTLSTIEGAGAFFDFIKGKKWHGGAGYEYSNWDGAGKFSGKRHHFFLEFSRGI